MKWLLAHIFRFLLSLRYKINFKGLEELENYSFPNKKGILFLSNHPSELDPLILETSLWHRFHPHPLAMDSLFYDSPFRFLMDLTGAIPIPSFDESANSYKKKQMNKTYERVFDLLEKGENLLIYPAGGLKTQSKERVGATSGVETILHHVPDVNIVLVRITGLWGSCFSKALTSGKTPDLVKTILFEIKVVFKNLVFFVPRRELTVEFSPQPLDFPYTSSRLEINHYLENWFNKQEDPLTLVSYSFWKRDLPTVPTSSNQKEKKMIQEVDEAIKSRIIDELALVTKVPKNEITLDSQLSTDLGLDSLDQSQIVLFLKEEFGINGIYTSDLVTVGDIIAFAGGIRHGKGREEEERLFPMLKEEHPERPSLSIPESKTVIEAFLKKASQLGHYIACGDLMAGFKSYRQIKLRVILLALALKRIPEERIGIMLPSSVAVNVLILAAMLAKKVPVMINWTLGPRNLKAVVEQSTIKRTLSSYRFVSRLDNVDLDGVDEGIEFLEVLARKITLKEKLQALFLSMKSPEDILKSFGLESMTGDEVAALLFTSGTESTPKGVPLTHRNLLTNARDAFQVAKIKNNDLLLGVLPPFHSFGFSVTGLFFLFAGMKVAYLPNPTDGRRIAMAMEKWNATLLCSAPSFLKNVVRVGSPEQFKTLRVVVSGAEKAPSDLIDNFRRLNPSTVYTEGYGITECSPVLTLNPLEGPWKGVGVPLPSVELLIVDLETQEILPRGKEGLILARGDSIFSGYLDPSLPTPFVEIAGKKWYRTGDLGILDENNYLTLSGRLKRFVKIGGEMISLGAIEETLIEGARKKGLPLSEDVPSIAVIAREEEGKRPEIILFTTLDFTVDMANNFIREGGLSNLSRVASVIKLSFIPILGTGKVDYMKLSTKINNNSQKKS